MKRNGKVMLIMAFMVLGGGANATAIEREGEILFPAEEGYTAPVQGLPGLWYRLDVNGDGVEDYGVGMIYYHNGPREVISALARYFTPGTRIVFEDEGVVQPNSIFGAGRIIGFTIPNGTFIRLDQMFSQEVIKQYFPCLWEKIQAEQRGSR